MRHAPSLLTLAVLLCLAGCKREEDTVLRVGAVLALSGGEAAFGQSVKKGIELALEEANAGGGVRGRRVELRAYDSRGTAEEAAAAMTRLLEQDRVLLVIGEVSSGRTLAIAPLAQARRVPLIAPAATHPDVTRAGDYVFRVCFVDDFQGRVMARYARETLKLGRLGVLYDTRAPYSVGLRDVFVREFEARGGTVAVQQTYAQGDTDFRAQLAALKAQKPEAVWVPGYYGDVGLIARQARELGLGVPLLGGDGWLSPRLFELADGALEGSYLTSHFAPDAPGPTLRRFSAAFERQHGEPPDSAVALGYDAAGVALQALRSVKEPTGPALRDALARTRAFHGASGTLTLDAQRNAVKSAVVLQVRGGQARWAATVEPEPVPAAQAE